MAEVGLFRGVVYELRVFFRNWVGQLGERNGDGRRCWRISKCSSTVVRTAGWVDLSGVFWLFQNLENLGGWSGWGGVVWQELWYIRFVAVELSCCYGMEVHFGFTRVTELRADWLTSWRKLGRRKSWPGVELFVWPKLGDWEKGWARDGAGTYRSWAANFRLERLVDHYSYLLLAIHNPSFFLLRRVWWVNLCFFRSWVDQRYTTTLVAFLHVGFGSSNFSSLDRAAELEVAAESSLRNTW